MFCASNFLSVRFSCLTLSSQCKSSDYTFFPLNDCPSYDSPVPQFRVATQKEGEEPAPDMDIHTSLHLLHLLPVFVVVEGRCWKCWTTSSLVKSILPQPPCLALTHFHVLPTRQVGRRAGLAGLVQPSLPHTTYSTVQKQSAMREKHQLIPLARRQGGRESDKNSISKKWGLHGSISAVKSWESHAICLEGK